MKRLIGLLISGALIAGGSGALAQDNSIKSTTKEIGHDTKKAAKATGKKVKKTTKKVVHKSAKVTRKGAEKVEDKTDNNK
jgi:hypothetical protein